MRPIAFFGNGLRLEWLLSRAPAADLGIEEYTVHIVSDDKRTRKVDDNGKQDHRHYFCVSETSDVDASTFCSGNSNRGRLRQWHGALGVQGLSE